MEKYHIALTETEAATLAAIDLRLRHPNHDEGRAAFLRNGEPILALVRSLAGRDAIPAVRRSYWKDPDYNKSGVKTSRRGIFEKNGTRGHDIYIHPDFVRYLRYFLFGADLPDAVISAFEEKVGNPEWVTSSDIVPIGHCAHDLTRQYRLPISDAPEEFFKLCLDMGLGLPTAESVMRAVKQVRG